MLAVVAGRSTATQLTRASFVCLLSAGLALRFYHLGAESLWLDELWTAAATNPRLPFRQLMDAWILPDVHPPLYYFGMRLWHLFFGAEEWVLRLPSALMSAACVAVAPLVQRWTPVVDRPWALATWFAVSTGAICYAQEARSYTLVLLLAIIATCLSVAITRRIEEGWPIRGAVVLMAAVTVVLQYVHYFGVLVAVAVFAAPFLFALLTGNRRVLATIGAAAAASLLLFLPWLMFHVPHIARRLGGYFWIANNWTDTFPEFTALAAGTPALFIAICAAVAGALAWRPGRLRRPAYFAPIVMIAIMLSGAIAISLHTPVITPRNLMILLPPFYIVAIAALADLEDISGGAYRVTFRLMPAVLAALNLGFAIHRMATQTNDQWRDAAAYVATLPGCESGPLAVNEYPKQVYAYYLPPAYRERLVQVAVNKAGPTSKLASALKESPCPILLWTGHTVGEGVVGEWLRGLGIDRRDASVRAFKGHNIVLRKDAAGAAAKPLPLVPRNASR